MALNIPAPTLPAKYTKRSSTVPASALSPVINVKWMGLGELDARMRKGRREYFKRVRLSMLKGGRLLAAEVRSTISRRFPAVGYRPKGRSPKYGTLRRSIRVKSSVKMQSNTAWVAVRPALLGQAYGKVLEQGAAVYRRVRTKGGKGRTLIGPFQYRKQAFLFPSLDRTRPAIIAMIQQSATSTFEKL